ncbi:hypothetical protein [Paenibacillus kobensis]|uniref:hypothetical protein n=1 Tax=Paenibacillus kobensis TaxID=59841 RepID=UPI000FD9D6A7|nr:hypothetical protein [Paenibacillus kobensis]
MLYQDHYTAEQLHRLRQDELNRAIRLGLYVKHDDNSAKPHRRKSILHKLLHLMKGLNKGNSRGPYN